MGRQTNRRFLRTRWLARLTDAGDGVQDQSVVCKQEMVKK